ncbi:MAG: PrsW family intramembrane metalloprotease [Thermoplasmata archaeon]
MIGVGSGESLVLLLLVALVPALVYLSWVRRAVRFQGEAWTAVLGAFAYGALFATVTAGILEVVIVGLGNSVSQRYPAPEFVFLNANSTAGAFFLVLVVAPFVEEALKASGVYAYRDRICQPSDGPVLGASVGLGFGFFETFLYGIGAFLLGGLVAGIVIIAIRGVSSVVLHGASTGMFGHGFARSQSLRPGAGTGSYYLLAVAMHASFNALASLTVLLALFGIGGVAVELASVVALVAASAFALGAIEHVRAVIQTADYPAIAGYRRPPPSRGAPPTQR